MLAPCPNGFRPVGGRLWLVVWRLLLTVARQSFGRDSAMIQASVLWWQRARHCGLHLL